MNCYKVINENECIFAKEKSLNFFTSKKEFACIAEDQDLINYHDSIFCKGDEKNE